MKSETEKYDEAERRAVERADYMLDMEKNDDEQH